MGAPADSDPDRRPASQAESLDDSWTTESPAPDSPAQHDRTTHGFYVEPAVPRTAVSGNNRPFSILGADGVAVPREEVPKLVQPERSPLAYVMGDETPNAVPRAGRSHDSSRFVMALIGDTPPPTVEAEVPVIPTMQPALRRGRLRRQWGALAAMGVIGVAVAIKLATSAHAPRPSTPEAKVAAAPIAPAPAPPSTVVPEPPRPSSESGSAAQPGPVEESVPAETAPPAPPPVVAVAAAKPAQAPAKASPSKKSKKAKHKSTAVAKQSSAAKKPSTKKNLTTAKKSTPAGNARSPKKRPS